MKNFVRTSRGRAVRLAAFVLVAAALVAGVAHVSSVNVSANHPVLVEGNCESPVPGTTIVTAGTCGDYDGDGRVGTAEDTDGADRIFGTINAALGPGTGAAAGTGANQNGKIIIVTSGRFPELIYIGQNLTGPGGPGVADPGNVILEAAPGVEANIDAVLQGDPAGGNNTRQASTGIQVVYTNPNRFAVLRNLQVRNFLNGIDIARDSRVHIDNCRLDSNLNFGIQAIDNARVVITRTQVDGTGFRIGTSPLTVANPGNGITADNNVQMRIGFTTVSNSAGAGIANRTGGGFGSGAAAANVVLFKVETYFNGSNIFGGITIAPDHNFSS